MKPTAKTIAALALLTGSAALAGNEMNAASDMAPSNSATGFLVGKLTGETAMDQLWSAATLYKDESNPILQEFALQGRHQIQFADGDGDSNDNFAPHTHYGDHIEARRARYGFKSKWFNAFKFDGQIDVWPQLETDRFDSTGNRKDGFYRNIFDLYITYAPSDAFNFSAGKTKAKFGREQEISSREILPFERSLLSNQLNPGELTGIWTSGKGISGGWLYEAGIYSNDRDRDFSNFGGNVTGTQDSGAVFLGKVGYDYSDASGMDTAVASFHYLYNSEPGYNNGQDYSGTSPRFGHQFAITNDISKGRFGLVTDLYAAIGDDNLADGTSQSNVFGLSLIPSYFIADSLQLVGAFQVASSDTDGGKRGLAPFARYDGGFLNAQTGATGNFDTYWSAYAGLNYYIYGHKLKLMNGIQFSGADSAVSSEENYSFLSGLRFAF